MPEPTVTVATNLLDEKPWGAFLAELDTALPQQVILHCLDGFVLKALYDMPRITADIDYVRAVPSFAVTVLNRIAGQDSDLAKKHKVYLQFTKTLDMPENYEQRLRPLDLGLSSLRLMMPDPYDFLLSKLTRNSPKDREDVKFVIKHAGLKFEVLEKRFEDEMKPWAANPGLHRVTLKLWKEYF